VDAERYGPASRIAIGAVLTVHSPEQIEEGDSRCGRPFLIDLAISDIACGVANLVEVDAFREGIICANASGALHAYISHFQGSGVRPSGACVLMDDVSSPIL